jgi:hypothetical protein
MRKPGLYFVVACIVLSLLALMPTAHVKAANGNIVGTWTITVTVNTPPGAPPFVFTDLIAFNSGGTLTAASTIFNAHTSENPLLPPPLVVDTSEAYGAWKSMGDDSNQFAVTFDRFLFAGPRTSTELYGSFFPGQYVGKTTVQAVGTPDGDSISGSFTNQFVNLGGQTVFAGSGTFTGTRLKIEPLAP